MVPDCVPDRGQLSGVPDRGQLSGYLTVVPDSVQTVPDSVQTVPDSVQTAKDNPASYSSTNASYSSTNASYSSTNVSYEIPYVKGANLGLRYLSGTGRYHSGSRTELSVPRRQYPMGCGRCL